MGVFQFAKIKRRLSSISICDHSQFVFGYIFLNAAEAPKGLEYNVLIYLEKVRQDESEGLLIHVYIWLTDYVRNQRI
jgi:hypothetical protein